MLRRNLFKTAATVAGSSLLSTVPAVRAMEAGKRPLQAIALCAIELPPEEFASQAKKAGYEMMGLRIHPIVPGALAHEHSNSTLLIPASHCTASMGLPSTLTLTLLNSTL